MKKLVTLTLCVILALVLFATSVAAASFTYDSFVAGNGYGTIEKVSDNIMKMKSDSNSSYRGPYSTAASTAKLADGIKEETYVEINLDDMQHGELFAITVSLKDEANGYVSEFRATSQKVQENVVVTAIGDSNFKATIKENGIYTYRFNIFIEGSKTYATFTLLSGETVVGTTGKIDMDTIVTSDTKNPIAEQNGVHVGSLWFNNIQVKNGINVYTTLPNNKVDFEQPKDEVISVKDTEKTEEILRDSFEKSNITVNPIDDVKIVVKVDEVDNVDNTKMEEALAKKATEAKMTNFYDITLPVIVNGNVAGNLTELTNKIKLTLQIPEEMPEVVEGYNRVYYIVREHNGEISILDTVINEDNTISFETDKFSTYALAYADVKKVDETVEEDKKGEKDETPKTGVSTYLGISVATIVISTLAIVTLKKKNA